MILNIVLQMHSIKLMIGLSCDFSNDRRLDQVGVVSEALVAVVYADETEVLRFLDMLLHYGHVYFEMGSQLVCGHTRVLREGLTYFFVVCALTESFELNGLYA